MAFFYRFEMGGLFLSKNDVHQFQYIRYSQFAIGIHVTPHKVLYGNLSRTENDVHQYGYIRDCQLTITVHVAQEWTLILHGTNGKASPAIGIGDTACDI